MPDSRTVYQSDDGTDVVFFKFVADKPGDLSAGRLYAAKVNQDKAKSDAADTGFDIEWIFLGANNEASLEKVIAGFDSISTEDFTSEATSYISEAEIARWAEKMLNSEPLSEREKAIPFLETPSSKALGASAEFRKMKKNINQKAAAKGSVPYMYLAMSEISEGMSDDKGDIRLQERKCGVVYRMKLDSEFNVSRMEPAVTGGIYDSKRLPIVVAIDF